jgi:hypothetical protein
MKSWTVVGTSLLSCLVVAPAGSWAQVGGMQVPGGMSLPGVLSKDSLLKQAKGLLTDLTSMKSSGKLPAAQGQKVDELLPKAQSLNDELEKPQLDTARLPQLAVNLNDLQKQVGVLKGFMK